MKDFIGEWCSKYLQQKNKKKIEETKKINDEKLKEVYLRFKQLEEFVQFLNTKVFRNRHERKQFWQNVQKGLPVLEDTLKRMLQQYGVKNETISELEKRTQQRQENVK